MGRPAAYEDPVKPIIGANTSLAKFKVARESLSRVGICGRGAEGLRPLFTTLTPSSARVLVLTNLFRMSQV